MRVSWEFSDKARTSAVAPGGSASVIMARISVVELGVAGSVGCGCIAMGAPAFRLKGAVRHGVSPSLPYTAPLFLSTAGRVDSG